MEGGMYQLHSSLQSASSTSSSPLTSVLAVYPRGGERKVVSGCSSSSQCTATALVNLEAGDVVSVGQILSTKPIMIFNNFDSQVRLEIEGGRIGPGAAFNSFSGHKLDDGAAGRDMRCF